MLGRLDPKQAIAEGDRLAVGDASDPAARGRSSTADRRSDDSFELCVVERLSFVKGSSVS